jgi:hypothetical protein
MLRQLFQHAGFMGVEIVVVPERRRRLAGGLEGAIEPLQLSAVLHLDRLVGRRNGGARTLEKGRETAIRLENENGVSRTIIFRTRGTAKALARVAGMGAV